MIGERLRSKKQTGESLVQHDIHSDQNEKDPKFIRLQLNTLLKERFNVLLSVVEYGISDGHLVRQGAKEPFIESIRRGRDVIQRLSYNPVDVDRENAEIIGFGKVDSFLSDPSASIDSKMLSISPKGKDGSKYEHNFYDIFTLRERDGQRYVELSRYSSGLTRRDYAKRLGMDVDNPPRDSDFLENPIQGGVSATPEEIHKALHIDHAYMEPQEFDEIWTSSFVQACVRGYISNRGARSFNAILNAADVVWENNNRKEKGQTYRDYLNYTPSYGELRYLEEKEVRQVKTPCPGKSGADIKNSPFSVSDFSMNDKYGSSEFDCPECGKKNTRPKDELVSNCQHCGSDKVSC